MKHLQKLNLHFLYKSLNLNSSKCQLSTSAHLFNLDSDSENSNESKKILKVAIIGCPNAGKSTMINQVVGRTVFAISKKVHTTKCCAKAVFNEGCSQIVFLDTPGLVSTTELEKYKLSPSYFRGGENAIVEADLIGVVQDVSNTFTRDKLDPKVLRLLHLYQEKESVLILNKVDTVKEKRLLLSLSDKLTRGQLRVNPPDPTVSVQMSEVEVKNKIKKQHYWPEFSQIFMVSALLGTGIGELRNYLAYKARPGKWIFSTDTFTDKKPVRIIEEAVRAKLLEYLPQEIPYNLDVQLEYLDMENEELITAVVLVSYGADRLEKLIRGYNGRKLKLINSEAEQMIADTFLSDVFLQIVLKKKEKVSELSEFA